MGLLDYTAGLLGFGPSKGGAWRLVQGAVGGPGSFRPDLERQIAEFQMNDDRLGRKATMREIAENRGVSLDSMINDELDGVRGYSMKWLDRISSWKDGFEDIKAGADALGNARSFLGKYLIPGFKGDERPERRPMPWYFKLPLSLAVQTVYSAALGLLGFTSGTYRFSPGGVKDYFVDVMRGYAGAVIKGIPFLRKFDKFLELTTNMDDLRPRMAKTLARRLKKKMDGLESHIDFPDDVEESGRMKEYDSDIAGPVYFRDREAARHSTYGHLGAAMPLAA
ncbi:MAG: hypothetical protein OXR66_06655 [Candidatus Woesearchaeota archaeon]|nr:hypothetical protein [Candidatus Woesearchaeota archaeon]